MLSSIGAALWGAPTVAALLICGLVLSRRAGFVQIRCFGLAIKTSLGRIFRRSASRGASPLEAVCTALAGTVGTGNIAGVAIALSLGGPGAVFWMWVSALVGMGIKYTEIRLAVQYRERRGAEYVGGPMYTVKNGLGKRFAPLAALFAVSGAVASFGVGNMMQVGSILTMTGGDGPVPAWAVCALLAVMVYLTCRGGAAGRGRAAAMIVPAMALLYMAGALTVILVNVNRLPEALASIFTGAFSGRAGLGAAMSVGFRRGLFSNEAGMGSSPIAHASADAPDPENQALMGIFEVFVDTILICTLTALMLLTGLPRLEVGTMAGAEACAAALAGVFGERAAGLFMTGAMGLFAFSSIVGWSLYGERCVQFLAGDRAAAAYRLLFAAAALLPAFFRFTAIVGVSDILGFFMLAANMTSLMLLTRRAGQPQGRLIHPQHQSPAHLRPASAPGGKLVEKGRKMEKNV